MRSRSSRAARCARPAPFVGLVTLVLLVSGLLIAGVAVPSRLSAEAAAAEKTAPTEKPGAAAKDARPGAAQSAPKKAEAKKPEAADALRKPELAKAKAPEKFRVELSTTKGPIVVEVQRAWSPNGADRFYNLVKIGFYDEIALFRVIDGFMAQFGIHGDPAVNRVWQRATIPDDAVVQSNLRGMLSFAKTNRPNSRTTQIFINFSDNKNLDGMGFSPFAKVVDGMDVVDAIYKVGEGGPRGPGPGQRQIQAKGNAYLKSSFPKLDYITGARVLD